MPAKGTKAVATNRRARHDYDVLETFECGIALANFNDFQEGDTLEAYRTEQIKA